jgi:hypothetical protein
VFAEDEVKAGCLDDVLGGTIRRVQGRIQLCSYYASSL